VTTTRNVTDGIDLIGSDVVIPTLGTLAINAFVLHGPEPMLVDTGPIVDRDAFMDALRSSIDPAELRWIWLSHTDFDHIGALPLLLAENPHLRVITSFAGVGIMGLYDPLPMDRVHLINPGETIEIGDRTLTAFRPPTFDNPITTGFLDRRSGTLFSSDCFGAVLESVPDEASDLSEDELRQGQMRWTTVDSPWIHRIDRSALARELDGVRAMEPSMILSSHLPPAPGTMTEQMLSSLAATPDHEPFVGPDQASFEQLMAMMAG
jgi:flavorubredoxin